MVSAIGTGHLRLGEYRDAKRQFKRRDPPSGYETLDVRRYQKGFGGQGVPWHTGYSQGPTPKINPKLTPKQRAERIVYGVCVLEDTRGSNSCRSDIYEAVTALANAGGLEYKKVQALLNERLEQLKTEEARIPRHYQDLKKFVDSCMK